jgi:DNA repair exonuclease SbcCD nuclease subunit
VVRFIHAADLHLDSPFSGLRYLPEKIWQKVRESTFLSLHRIVTTAIEQEVDFLLISGDVYDVDERSIKAQAKLKKEMERLNHANIPVFMIHGNHDFLSDNTLHLTLPNNVKVFKTQVETVEWETNQGERIAISGFSYGKKWINERMIKDYPKRLSTVDRHIGLLHGFEEGETSPHAKYAPFSKSELIEKEYDYWALGHIHLRKQISNYPLAYYSGNTQGRHRNEAGPKGCLLVELNDEKKNVEFFPTAPITWEYVKVDVQNYHLINEIFEAIKDALPKNDESQFVSLELEVSEELSEMIRKKLQEEDFTEALSTQEKEYFQWIVDIRLNESKADRLPALETLFPEAWKNALEEVFSSEEFQNRTNEFFHHTNLSTLLKDRDESYREFIRKQAMKQLEHRMLEEGEIRDED